MKKKELKTHEEREDSIKKNTDGIFIMKKSSLEGKKQMIWDKIYNMDSLGKRAIHENHDIISKYAQKHNVDPDLIRAVMYAENARGHKGGLNAAAEYVGFSTSKMPMNIQESRWKTLVNASDLNEKEKNIEAGTILLKRIRDRVSDPSPENIGTLWNNLKDNETSKFGEYIGTVYREKPWAQIN